VPKYSGLITQTRPGAELGGVRQDGVRRKIRNTDPKTQKTPETNPRRKNQDLETQ